MNWIDIKEQRPDNEGDVLVFYKTVEGLNRILLASYAGKYELEADGEAFGGMLDYSEEDDIYYAPEGWYESSEHHSECGYIYMSGIEITHWMNKPEPPE